MRSRDEEIYRGMETDRQTMFSILEGGGLLYHLEELPF